MTRVIWRKKALSRFHGRDFHHAAAHQALQCGQRAGFALADEVGLAQVVDVDGG